MASGVSVTSVGSVDAAALLLVGDATEGDAAGGALTAGSTGRVRVQYTPPAAPAATSAIAAMTRPMTFNGAPLRRLGRSPRPRSTLPGACRCTRARSPDTAAAPR